MDSGKRGDVIFLDFQKAFDKGSHKCLLLNGLGIDGQLLDWLRDGKQRVVVSGCTSAWADVSSGVPQGSVLGPLLFLAYINDMDNSVQSSVKKFADDTKLYCEVSTEEDAISVQEDLDRVLSGQIGKCSLMLTSVRSCILGMGILELNIILMVRIFRKLRLKKILGSS